MVTEKWNPKGEGTISPLDETLKVDWRINESDLIISERDLGGISFNEYDNDPKF